MTPAEYRALRKTIASQKKVAAALGVDYRTIQRREVGEIKIPREAALALTYIAAADRKRCRKGKGPEGASMEASV